MSLDCTAQHEPKQSKEEPAKRSERRTLQSHQFKAKAKFQASWASAFDFFFLLSFNLFPSWTEERGEWIKRGS